LTGFHGWRSVRRNKRHQERCGGERHEDQLGDLEEKQLRFDPALTEHPSHPLVQFLRGFDLPRLASRQRRTVKAGPAVMAIDALGFIIAPASRACYLNWGSCFH